MSDHSKGRGNAPIDLPAHDSKGRKAGIRAAMAQVKNGRTIPTEDVEAWVNSWDTPNELPLPRPRRR